MNDILISIVVPCYNQSEYLEECLRSVLEQSYDNWECIIVNDGSLDNTEEVVLRWIKRDSRFKYIFKENGGVASARNLGIKNSKADWILPLDGDDKIGSKYLELAVKHINESVTIIYCEANFFGEINEFWNLPEYKYNDILKNNIIFCSALFRKADWKKVNGYDSNLIYGYEDWDFWLSILNNKSKVYKIKYLGFFYRRKKVSRDSLINSDNIKKNEAYNYIYKKHLNKYLMNSSNGIDHYNKISSKLDELKLLCNYINKNKLTKLLYKLIKIINS